MYPLLLKKTSRRMLQFVSAFYSKRRNVFKKPAESIIGVQISVNRIQSCQDESANFAIEKTNNPLIHSIMKIKTVLAHCRIGNKFYNYYGTGKQSNKQLDAISLENLLPNSQNLMTMSFSEKYGAAQTSSDCATAVWSLLRH